MNKTREKMPFKQTGMIINTAKMHLAVLNALTVIAETKHYNLTCLPNIYLKRSVIYKTHAI